MDSETLKWVIPLVTTIIGGTIGWFVKYFQEIRKEKKQLGLDADQTLKEKKSLLEDLISKTDNADKKAEYQYCIDDVNAALLGLSSARVRRTLKDAELPTEERLVVEGKNQLKPQQLARLNKEVDELSSLSLSDSIPDLLFLGNAYYYSEKYLNAIKYFDRILSIDPNYFQALNNRGLSYLKLGKSEQALSDFNLSLKILPNQPITLNNRGNLYLHLKKYDDALSDLNRSLELRPNNYETLANRSAVYLKQGNYNDAHKDMSNAQSINPNSPLILYNFACLFALQKNTDSAISFLGKAIKLDKKCQQDAKTDPDLDNIRNDPRFKELIGEN